jgi:tetratricopeptide (TPR) repeat protein
MSSRWFLMLGAAALNSTGCLGPRPVADAPSPPQLFDGMGSHHRRVTTQSAAAQDYFDQGLIWAFAFNHDEAIRSFGEAARLDPDCAMAYWGVALCNGPHINNPAMDAAHSRAAWAAIERAMARIEGATPVEQSLIRALARRYTQSPPADRKPLDEAYANAMREVWSTHRADADVGTLFAESLMDLRPWDLWAADGRPHPGTDEILGVLEDVLRIDPNHPGANHLYIHAVEASPTPEKALAAADRLCDLVPASGHLVHMPSHIYSRTGRWNQAAATNERAIEADRRYRKLSPRHGFYNIYMAHNHHFLTYAAMMEGRSALALRAAKDAIVAMPDDYARKESALVDGFMLVLLDTHVRFGRWNDILRSPAPPAHFPVTTAFWRFARSTAYAAKSDVRSAIAEQAAFRKAVAKVPPEATVGNNPASRVLAIADHTLAGEIAFREGRTDAAVAELRKAVEVEDRLKYDDPPDWMIPARHALGAVLVSAGRFAEAEAVYREDLARWPNNGWSLFGLAASLRGRGAAKEADEVERQFKHAWARADIRIGASCLCAARVE